MVDVSTIVILIIITIFIIGGSVVLAYIIRSSRCNDEDFKNKMEWPGKILLGENYKLSEFSTPIRRLLTWGVGLICVAFILGCIFALISVIDVFILR